MLGKKHSKVTISKMRKYQKNRPIYYHSEATKNLISDKRKDSYEKGINPFVGINKKTSKPIVQIDLQGNIIKMWPSCYIASKTLKISRGNLQEALKRPDNKPIIANGYYWRYQENVIIENNKLKDIDTLNRLRIEATSLKKS